jgi:hypothetical protein
VETGTPCLEFIVLLRGPCQQIAIYHPPPNSFLVDPRPKIRQHQYLPLQYLKGVVIWVFLWSLALISSPRRSAIPTRNTRNINSQSSGVSTTGSPSGDTVRGHNIHATHGRYSLTCILHSWLIRFITVRL